MSITQDQVVSIHYTLKDDAGEIIDASADGEPLAYLHGHGNLIPGPRARADRQERGRPAAGEDRSRDGYGEYDSALVQRVPRRALKGVPNVQVGMRLQAHAPRAHAR